MSGLGFNRNISMHKRVSIALRLHRVSARHEPLSTIVERGLAQGLLRKRAFELLLRREYVGQRLHLGSSSGYDLAALYLEQSAAWYLGDVLVVLFAIFLVLFVDVQQQFLQLIARQQILVVETRTHAQMEWLLRLFLARTLLEPRSLASQSKFNDVLRVHVLWAVLYNPLHIASFCANQSPGYLELFIIWNLDVEPACVLDSLVVDVRAEILVLRLVVSLVLWHHKRLRFELAYCIKYVFWLKHWGRLLLHLLRLKLKLHFGVIDLLAVISRVFLLLFFLGFNFNFQLGGSHSISTLPPLGRLLLLLARYPFDQQVDIVLL